MCSIPINGYVDNKHLKLIPILKKNCWLIVFVISMLSKTFKVKKSISRIEYFWEFFRNHDDYHPYIYLKNISKAVR